MRVPDGPNSADGHSERAEHPPSRGHRLGLQPWLSSGAPGCRELALGLGCSAPAQPRVNAQLCARRHALHAGRAVGDSGGNPEGPPPGTESSAPMPLADCEAERTGGYRARIQTPAQHGREAENPGRPCGLGDGGSRPWGFELTDGTYGQWIPETIYIAFEGLDSSTL